jgi:hypothetical protein
VTGEALLEFFRDLVNDVRLASRADAVGKLGNRSYGAEWGWTILGDESGGLGKNVTRGGKHEKGVQMAKSASATSKSRQTDLLCFHTQKRVKDKWW